MSIPRLPFYSAPQVGQILFSGELMACLKIPAQATGGSVSLVEHVLAPGVLGAPPHTHQHEEECSYVLEGCLSVQVGEGVLQVEPGGVVVKPRGQPHAFWNAGNTPVRFLEVISPGGFEGYFIELGELLARAPGAQPELAAIEALGERYGVRFDFAAIPSLLAHHGLRLPR